MPSSAPTQFVVSALGLGVIIGGFAFFLLVFVCIYFLFRFNKNSRNVTPYPLRTKVNSHQIYIDKIAQTKAGRIDAEAIPYEVLSSWTSNFRNENKLGEGKFGMVYSCYVAGLRDGLAIKKMKTFAMETSEKTMSSLNIEVRVLSAFKHPNIIRLLGYSASTIDTLCLVYELGTLGDLSQVLINDDMAEQFTWKIRIRIACGIVKALNYLHCHQPNQPAYHRDVKSANIVLMADFTPKLIDCGLAKYVDENFPCEDRFSQGQTNMPLGTPGYMCRNYQVKKLFDAKAEIFSLGVVLLELISGSLQSSKNASDEIRFLEDELEENILRPDERAGTWDQACVHSYLQLARGCIIKHSIRIEKMTEVLRRICNIEIQFCSTVICPPAQLNTPKCNCEICFDEYAENQGLYCKGNGESKHFLCEGCFSNQVESNVGPYSRGTFIKNKGNILCVFCFGSYEDRDVAKVCRKGSYNLYRQACNELLVAEVIKEQQAKHQALMDEFRRAVEQRGRTCEAIVYRHRLHIVDTILTLHCPHVNCNVAFLDWDGCFAVTCNACNSSFCGWCLTDQGRDAHPHVKACPQSLQPGGYFGTQEQFNQVHRQRRTNEIQSYLASIHDVQLRNEVSKAIMKDLQDLGIHL